MSVGTLFLRVVLDRPTQLCCGPQEPVAGNVLVTWHDGPKSRSEPELFGPLRVVLSFHGRAKTKIWKSNGNHTHIYRGRAPFFATALVVHDGPIRIEKGTRMAIPFSVRFPGTVQSTNVQRDAFDQDVRFNIDPEQPLPPSFAMEYRGFAHHFETFNEYRVGASASMPRIDVDIRNVIEEDEPRVHYSPPWVPPPTLAMIQQQIVSRNYHAKVRNELLVPEAERASGFKQKTKAMFKADYYPLYTFTITTEGVNLVHLGSPLTFEVRIKQEDSPAPGIIIPEITMGALFSARIDAHTDVRAEKSIFRCPESEGNEDVLRLTGAQDTKGPFTKANDWTRVITTKPVLGLPSTFSTFNIARTYVLEISFTVSAAGEDFRIVYKWPFIIAPPLQAIPATNGGVFAGPSSVAGSSDLPLESAAETLPVYEGLPVYDKAAEVAAGNVQPA